MEGLLAARESGRVMGSYRVCMMGQNVPMDVDLPYADLEALMIDASRQRFILGHMTRPDSEGICPPVMIATSRIQCVIVID